MKQQLSELFTKYNIYLSQGQLQQFELYYALLIEWNQKFNLTAITEEHEVITKHFLDSVLPHKRLPQNAAVIDVGSGAGFPGIPLKIIRPDIKLTMLDSLLKRVGFLNHAVSELKLSNSVAIHSRAEDFALAGGRECFDVCVSRAVARLATLSEICLPFVKVGGMFIPSKSSEVGLELKECEKAVAVLGGKIEGLDEFNIAEINAYRAFPVIKKIKPTPKQYPRTKNLPKTKPIL